MTLHQTSLMTSQERVNRMFARQDQDRIPRHDSFWWETVERWKREGLSGDQQTVLEMLGSDFQGLSWVWPQAFPGQEKILSEDEQTKVVRECNGRIARYWKHRSGTPEHLGFECDSRETWERRFKPALLKNWLQLDPAGAAKNFANARKQGKWTFLSGVEGFEESRQMIGDEVTLIAMADDPDWIIDVSRTFTDVVLQNLDAVMATGIQPDGVWIYGDMAFKTATMCSPAMYRELIWPDHKRMADWAHARGMKFIYHTDGDVNGVMDLYLKAGFDCLQPLEAKASMDVRKLCPKYGNRLAFFGNIDVMQMMTNDLERIDDEIRQKVEAGKATKGYVYHSDHSVPPQVSWQTYQAIIGMLERYGSYE